jgi:uncharacterized protein (TIGR03083 family)
MPDWGPSSSQPSFRGWLIYSGHGVVRDPTRRCGTRGYVAAMQLTPRYGDNPVLCVQTSLGDVSVPLLRQRARLADTLATLDGAEWAVPSRCAQWSVQDVVAHLVSTNQFWAFSISAGRSGEPTRFLADFDPVATPAALVDGVRSWSPAETLDRFVETNGTLASAVADLDDNGWELLAEAPPGHIALRAVVLHALWDAWVHERDIVLPLGRDVVEEPDEVAGCLQYAAALGPAFHATTGSTRRAALRIDATEPDVTFVVEAGPTVYVHERPPPPGTPVVAGRAVALLEALSLRAPLDPDVPEDQRWMLGGLASVFDAAV